MRNSPVRPVLLAALAAGSQLAQAGPSVPIPSVTPSDTGSAFGQPADDCHPERVVGATWTPSPIVCPFGPDPQALAVCAGSGVKAVLHGAPYPDVQQAIDAASPGDEVAVCPGTYDEVWTWSDLALVAADPTPEATVLSHVTGDLGHEFHRLTRGEARGFTVYQWRGFEVTESGAFECITGSHSPRRLFEGSPQATDAAIEVRSSVITGAIEMVIYRTKTLLVEDCRFEGYVSWFGQNGGSLIDASSPVDGEVVIRRTAFVDNRTTERDWALVEVGRGTVTIEDCWFERNVQADNARSGLVHAAPGDNPMVIRNTTFLRNEVEREGTVTISGPSLEITDSSFVENAGGVTATPPFNAPLLNPSGSGDLVLERTVMIENSSAGDHTLMDLSSDDSVQGRDIVAYRTSAAIAAMDTSYASFSCTCCDFGLGSDDNVPADAVVNHVLVDDLPLDFTLP